MTFHLLGKKPPQVFLKSLYLRNFRNYKEAEVEFSEKENIFYGDNGQGKTNLLEAIYLVATGRSFRTETLSELIHFGEPFFFLEAEIVKETVLYRIKISFDGKNRRIELNGNRYSSFHPLLGILPSVLYTPYDIELIIGAPSQRRRFLNLHLAQSDPLYVHHLTRFWRAMKQRNSLLKKEKTESIDCWEAEMAQSNDYIVEKREQMIDWLQNSLREESDRLTIEKERYELELHISSGRSYLEQLRKNRKREMELGMTLTGSHRDDLSILVNGKNARIFGSEGQKKTAVGALKIAEWKRLSEQTGGPAIMGFDDLAHHLDAKREKLLENYLDSLGQVFITTPHPPHQQKGKQIRIEQGVLFRDCYY